jgi:hypothetical protein
MRIHRISFVALALIGLGLVALGLAGTSAVAVGGFLDGERDPAHPYDGQIRDNARNLLAEGRRPGQSRRSGRHTHSPQAGCGRRRDRYLQQSGSAQPGSQVGFYHDGRFANLLDGVNH